MSTHYDAPRSEHILVREPDPPGVAAPGANAWRIPGMLAEARRLEQRRRLATAEDKLAALVDRVAALEPAPAPTDREPHAADVMVEPVDPNRPTLGHDDIEWVIDGWREHDWH